MVTIERKQLGLRLKTEDIDVLRQEASKLDISINDLLKLKIFSKNQTEAGSQPTGSNDKRE